MKEWSAGSSITRVKGNAASPATSACSSRTFSLSGACSSVAESPSTNGYAFSRLSTSLPMSPSTVVKAAPMVPGDISTSRWLTRTAAVSDMITSRFKSSTDCTVSVHRLAWSL
ncbi:hypothetical protein BBBOND_0211020 [Babesia bigemina]|uniref:Uncharacterized protein n=1 Tax=Babesia bigemina TaxID=5866 RepID=A0A061DD50_BABBI|nr:hypothetical protein BBBOND_0211020 [Babesia bigemina]CDR95955.1 hypothetical protein BBBOND_0211020 [Babesia bigemina]|eukprot:XP_012768141.1 hypothetical protein BBBOND_0211020 [Babesia bigemina]